MLARVRRAPYSTICVYTGDVWVGGKCGRMWVGRAASTNWSQWDPVQSQTSAHVTDISFTTQSDEPVGYVNAFRFGINQCIVRVRD